MKASSRFAFVLVRPQSSGNVGAAARALKNMGFNDLRLVAPTRYHPRDARAMAAHAGDLLATAAVYADLPAALADRTIVVGTTARGGLYRAEAEPPREAAATLVAAAATNPVALVFGPEDFGLTNDDLKYCNRLVTIPTDGAYSSLNLAQAVLIVAYELRLADAAAALANPASASCDQFATSPQLDAMFTRLQEALVTIGFIPEHLPDHIMFAFRAMLGRGGILPRELDILNGLARQIRWFGEGGHATLAAKRQAGRSAR